MNTVSPRCVLPRSAFATCAGLCAVAALVAGLPAYGTPGDLDPTFDEDGRVLFDVAGDADAPASVVQQPDGKLVVGRRNEATDDDFSVLRFDVDGTLDPAFDGDGRTSLDVPGIKGTTEAVLLQADGRIVAAGTARDPLLPAESDFALVRYNPDGSVDLSFGVRGVVTHDFDGGNDYLSAVIQQPDGRLIAAGHTYRPGGATPDMAFVRFDPDGSLDRSFGANGVVIVSIFGGNGIDQVSGLVQQADGRLLAVGLATPSNPFTESHMAVVRLTPDGMLDDAFDGDGRAVVALTDTTGQGAGSLAVAGALVVDADGRIVVAGSANSNVWGYDSCSPVLARLNPDGSADTTFGSAGTVWVGLAECADIQALAIEGDRGFLVTGTIDLGYSADHFVARLTPTGDIDPSFGIDGLAIIDVGIGSDAGRATSSSQYFAVQSDGRVVTATSVSVDGEVTSFDRLVVARLRMDGVYAGLLGLNSTLVEAREDAGIVAITVRRLGGSDGAVSVDFTTESDAALSGVDFTGASGTLTWNDGDTSDKTIEIGIAPDSQREGSESLVVILSNPSGGASLGTGRAEIRILDSTSSSVPPSNGGSENPATGQGGGGGAIGWWMALAAALVALGRRRSYSSISTGGSTSAACIHSITDGRDIRRCVQS